MFTRLTKAKSSWHGPVSALLSLREENPSVDHVRKAGKQHQHGGLFSHVSSKLLITVANAIANTIENTRCRDALYCEFKDTTHISIFLV